MFRSTIANGVIIISALHLAVAGDHQQFVKLLLDAGANIDAQDEQQRTPLIDAIAAGAHQSLIGMNG